jgi:hypothetical protein
VVAKVRYSVVGGSGCWVTSCAVYTMHVEIRSTCFLVEPQNPGQRFVSGLASQPLGRFVSGLASKPLGRFISDLASKPLGRFSTVWPQNQWRQFLPVWPQDRWLGFPGLSLKINSYNLMIWASKSPRWFLGLGLKTKQASVCRLCLKIGGRM